MNIPDLLSMDYYEDDSPVSPTPNEFVLSVYKESPFMTVSQGRHPVNFKRLPRKRRQSVTDQFDEEDAIEFEKYAAERSMHAR